MKRPVDGLRLDDTAQEQSNAPAIVTTQAPFWFSP
jgi:hypothetical protein